MARTAAQNTRLSFSDASMMPARSPTGRRVYHQKTADLQTRLSLQSTHSTLQSSVSLPSLVRPPPVRAEPSPQAKRTRVGVREPRRILDVAPSPPLARRPSEVQEATSEELQARRHMVRMQRLVQQQANFVSLEGVKARRRANASAMREEMDEASGKQLSRSMADVTPSSPRTVQKMSNRLNEAMAEYFQGQSGISGSTLLWYKFSKSETAED